MSRDTGRERDTQGDLPGQNPRTTAEWVTLGISIAILAVLFGAIGVFYLQGNGNPAVIEVTPLLEQIRQEGDSYLLPVEITNAGEQTAEGVTVSITLMVDDTEEGSADFTVDFLAGGATEVGIGVFTTDPRTGEIQVDTVSFVKP